MAEVQERPTLDEPESIELENAGSEDPDAANSQHVVSIEVIEPKSEYPVGLPAEMTIGLSCPEGCDLRGGTILVGDANDQVLAEQTITCFDEAKGLSTTDCFIVQIPKEPGTHSFTIIFFPAESDRLGSDRAESAPAESDRLGSAPAGSAPSETDVSANAGTDDGSTEEKSAARFSPEATALALHAITQTEYRFEAVGHITGMAAWRDDPNPVPVESEYVLNVGIKCVHGCQTPGQKVSIYHDDRLLATVDMLDPVPPLTGLFQNRVTLTAPAEVGTCMLECRIEPENLDLLHAFNAHPYALTTVAQPQCRLDLTAVKMSEGTPVDGAIIIVIPKDGYSGQVRTGADGKASIGVAWGEQQLRATCNDYQTVVQDITIPKGQEALELTLEMLYCPGRLE